MMRPLSKSAVNPDSVLLFTGGAKGITAQCALALVKQVSATYLLMGRSRVEAEPDWAVKHHDSSALKAAAAGHLRQEGKQPTPAEIEALARGIIASREIHETLQQFEMLGVRAVYVSADVLNAAQVKEQIARVERQYGRITGLVHGAGRLADKRIERKTTADYAAVFDTKVAGLQNVMQCLDLSALSLLVLFSSVAGAFGNVGQADYAMANEVLNGLAYQHQHQHPQCKVLSINWGPWDSGMVTPELKQAFEARGIHLISETEGANRFVDLVLNDQFGSSPQWVVGSAIKPLPVTRRSSAPICVQRDIEPAGNPFLLDHQIGENRVLPAACAAAWMADTCEKLWPGYQFFALRNFRVLKGLVFADETPQTCLINIETLPDASDDEVLARVNITGNGERPQNHYKAEVLLSAGTMNGGMKLNPLPAFTAKDEQAVLTAYHEKFLFHGPAFRGLKAISIGTEGFNARANLPAISLRTQGQYPARAVNPYLLDVILQGMLLWTLERYGAACLPAGIQSVEQYGRLEFDRDYFIETQVTEQSSTRIQSSAQVYDSSGRLCLRCEGVEGTLSQSLLPLFKSSRTSLEMAA